MYYKLANNFKLSLTAVNNNNNVMSKHVRQIGELILSPLDKPTSRSQEFLGRHEKILYKRDSLGSARESGTESSGQYSKNAEMTSEGL